jgi:hypothetical protein
VTGSSLAHGGGAPPERRLGRADLINKELEQSHICVGVSSFPQNHDDRYASYLLNIILGGSMSSRLFQNIREKRGLAYAVFSGLSAYRDAGHHDLRRLRQRGGHRGHRPDGCRTSEIRRRSDRSCGRRITSRAA